MAIAQRHMVRTSDGDEEMVGTGDLFQICIHQKRPKFRSYMYEKIAVTKRTSKFM